MTTKLRFTDGSGAFAYVCLATNSESVWLGRSARCAVRSAHLTVSSEHCRIFANNGRWQLENLSRNGTLLNGRAIDSPTDLNSGDEISCGRLRGLEVTFLQEDVQAPAAQSRGVELGATTASMTQQLSAPSSLLPATGIPTELLAISQAEAASLRAKLEGNAKEFALRNDDLAKAHKESASLRSMLDETSVQLAKQGAVLVAAHAERDQLRHELETERSECEDLRRRCKALDSLANERRQETIQYQSSSRDFERRLAATEATLTEAMRSLTEERKKCSQFLDARDEWERRKTAYEAKQAELLRDRDCLHQRLREALRVTGTSSSDVGTLLSENDVRVSQLEAQRVHIRGLERDVEQLHVEIKNRQTLIDELRQTMNEQQAMIECAQAELAQERASAHRGGAKK
jgi:predicted  nucleic acid-binding Zn-ribbon protein